MSTFANLVKQHATKPMMSIQKTTSPVINYYASSLIRLMKEIPQSLILHYDLENGTPIKILPVRILIGGFNIELGYNTDEVKSLLDSSIDLDILLTKINNKVNSLVSQTEYVFIKNKTEDNSENVYVKKGDLDIAAFMYEKYKIINSQTKSLLNQLNLHFKDDYQKLFKLSSKEIKLYNIYSELAYILNKFEKETKDKIHMEIVCITLPLNSLENEKEFELLESLEIKLEDFTLPSINDIKFKLTKKNDSSIVSLTTVLKK
jgi:hypothetical protein